MVRSLSDSFDPNRHFYYFCDESSQTADPWLAVAGLLVNRTAVPEIVKTLASIKEESGKTGEVKWENAKSYGGRVHRAYIDYLFLLVEKNLAHFHIRFSPMSEYDHSLSGKRRRTDTVSKSYYQLIIHRALRHYSKHGLLSVYPDDGECTSYLPTMLNALRNEDKNRFCGKRASCLQEIVPRSSAREPMLQLLDVTLGALAAYRNGRHLNPEISKTKKDLAVYAFEKTGWPSIDGNCAAKLSHLSRWNVTPSLKRGQGS